MARPVAERFWEKVEKGDGCWSWSPGQRNTGYGNPFYVTKAHGVPPHRMAYELSVGPIPTGRVIDHLCRNKGCVRPDHLEPVTQVENIRRGVRHTGYCPRGHAKTGDNLIIEQGYRRCRICRTAQKRAA